MKQIGIAALTACLAFGAIYHAGAAEERRGSQDNAVQTDQTGQSFQGRITAINRDNRTIVVDGKTYRVLPTSRMTRNTRQLEFGDLERGQNVSGTFKSSGENRLELLSLNVGRRTDRDVASSSGQDVRAASDQTSDKSGTSFSGRVDRVDRAANTLRINDQTYQILPTTQIKTEEGESVTLSRVRSNSRVTGTYKQSAEGKLEVLSLNVGRPERDMGGTTDLQQSTSGTSFGGRVDRVDASGRTLRINDRTFHILPTTQIKNAEGQPTTLNAIRDDQRVSGTYKESAEGRLEVLSLTVGRQQRD